MLGKARCTVGWMDSFPTLPCDLLPADGAAGMMGGPRAFLLHTALGTQEMLN